MSNLAALEKFRAQIKAARDSVPRIATEAAPLIHDRLVADSRTKKGNVGEFPGPPGAKRPRYIDDPITVTPAQNQITVHAADWIMQKAIDLDQPDAWIGIIEGVAVDVLGEAAS